MFKNLQQARTSEHGSALVYILIAIALLAALTMSFMEPSSQQTSSQNMFKTVSAVNTQADLIRAAIQECVLSYPRGDDTIDNSGSGSDPDARDNYPINPNSTHYSSATPGQSGDRLVKNIRCPGNNPGGSDVADHEKIFSGRSGKYLPPTPDLFDDWQYYSGTDGVFFWINTSKSDAFLASSLEKLDDNYAECEADVVDATSAARDLDSDGDLTCASGDLCFRVRMITNGTAVYNGDTDSDEGSC